MVGDFFNRIRYYRTCDRLGPDVPLTHWKLHFPRLMRRLCESKFKSFGDGAEFRPGAYAVTCRKISIGAHVVIRPGTMLFADPREGRGEIFVEDDVLIGSGVHVYTANHDFSDRSRPIIEQGHRVAKDVRIQSGAWIGANAILLSGVTIGRNAVVGAGSVVTNSVPEHTVVAGNPARQLVEKTSSSAGGNG